MNLEAIQKNRIVYYLLKKPELIKSQLLDIKSTIDDLKSPSSASEEASNILLTYLV